MSTRLRTASPRQAIVYNGAGTVLDTRTDVKAINADGSTTETVADYSNNGTLIDETATTVSSDGKTTTIEGDNNGVLKSGTPVFDQVETIAEQANGSITDTVSDYSSTGTLLATTVKTTAANGLSWTLQRHEGSGTVDDTQSGTTVLNADGSTTETFTDAAGAGEGVIYVEDSPQFGNHHGIFDNITVVTTTSANGLSKTLTTTGNNGDFSASNVVTDNTVINADGSSTETKAITVGGRASDTEIVNTSASGLSKTTQLSEAGNSTYDYTDTVAVGVDGSKTETITVLNLNGTLAEKDVTTTSANGQTVSLQSALHGSSAFNHFETIATNTDGSVTDTVWNTNASGATTDETVTTVSADKLSKTIQTRPGGGIAVQTQSDVTTLNADGSTTLVKSVLNGNGTYRSQAGEKHERRWPERYHYQ